MFCSKCGSKMDDGVAFCGNCGAPTNAGTPRTDSRAATAPPTTPVPAKPRRKRHIGCLIVLLLILALLIGVGYFVAGALWIPKDLGVRYTQADYDSAVAKIGLSIDFQGMNDAQLKAFVAANKGKKFAIADYNIAFSDYQEKTFTLTLKEANAFVNMVAPNFSWFDSLQFKVLPNGNVAGSYRVDFKKFKTELIPDLVDKIPPTLKSLLPDTFNLYTEGSASIVDNKVVVPEKLARLEVGAIPLQPLIGNLSEADRATVFGYTERIYNVIPDINIHSLHFNPDGTLFFAGYIPTKVTVTAK